MPTYEFVCEKCSKEFETTMTISERATASIKCPNCGSEKVTSQMAAFSPKTSRKS
jgi:putative FmdB family regulatory protein